MIEHNYMTAFKEFIDEHIDIRMGNSDTDAIETLDSSVDDHEDRIDTLENERQEHEARIDTLEEKIEALEATLGLGTQRIDMRIKELIDEGTLKLQFTTIRSSTF
jgi:predicted  nucleic acid-binding Zn-ribbon protein|tara:strand:+ start:1625 stop:1939 length:315 start_codon:yes stop_codon:yes gene_type:complete